MEQSFSNSSTIFEYSATETDAGKSPRQKRREKKDKKSVDIDALSSEDNSNDDVGDEEMEIDKVQVLITLMLETFFLLPRNLNCLASTNVWTGLHEI